MVEIVGAEGEISDVEVFLKQVRNYFEKHGVSAQVFDADMIYGKNHLISAVKHAERAIENGANSADSLEMEVLLYASGERQLKNAIPKMGVKPGRGNIAFVLLKQKNTDISDKMIGKMLDVFKLKRNDKVLEGDPYILKKFGIKDEELETVSKDKYEDLILEKVALVDIIK
ncbi:MAG: KEOPS complex subunit Cgi121 [Candidatus Thermoplasmatota archaeon]